MVEKTERYYVISDEGKLRNEIECAVGGKWKGITAKPSRKALGFLKTGSMQLEYEDKKTALEVMKALKIYREHLLGVI